MSNSNGRNNLQARQGEVQFHNNIILYYFELNLISEVDASDTNVFFAWFLFVVSQYKWHYFQYLIVRFLVTRKR